ncbi:MAG TPA: signal peptide peptidase SppA [Pseudomonadales bacterium]|nr:signal peptide peptidase SppA [Pseudomonadales bacterium]
MSEAPQQRRGIFRRIGGILSTARVFVANLLFVVLLVVIVVLLFGSGDDGVKVPDGAALVLRLDGPVLEAPPPPDPLELLFRDEDSPRPIALRDITEALAEAAEDERIEALYLDLSRFPGTTPAALHSIGLAIDAFRASGKPVIIGADALDQSRYYLASHADQLYLNPMGQVLLTGVAIQPAFYADLLEKLRVNVHVFRVGTYKAAVEPFIRDDMSPEAREDARALVQGLWEEWRAVVADHRGLPPEALDAIIEETPARLTAVNGDLARLALESGLVDELLTRDAVRARMIDLVGQDPDHESFLHVDHRNYLRNVRLAKLVPPPEDEGRVGVVVAEGTITGGTDPGQVGEAVARLIRDARDDRSVDAVVLRVNSPGGSAFFSEVIRRELELTQIAGKPVVVSMGGVAASGGYWISATADRIVAQADTITGSIGIFGIVPTFEDASDAIGVHGDSVGTHALSGAGNPIQPLNPALAQILQSSVEHGYEQFVDLVARGRDMTPENVDAIAQGRVWLGRTALELGLVDELGDVEDAAAIAAELAGLDQWRMDYLEVPKTPRQLIMEQLFAGPAAGWMMGVLDGPTARRISAAAAWAARPMVMLEALTDPRDLYAFCAGCPSAN